MGTLVASPTRANARVADEFTNAIHALASRLAHAARTTLATNRRDALGARRGAPRARRDATIVGRRTQGAIHRARKDSSRGEGGEAGAGSAQRRSARKDGA